MLKFSRQVEYALQLLLALSGLKEGNMLSIKTFSEEAKVSFLFLQKIALSLRKSGLIEAERGAQGGYFLKKPLKSITLKEIIEAVEGPYHVVSCMSQNGCCANQETCTVRPVFETIEKDMTAYLSQYTVSDLVGR